MHRVLKDKDILELFPERARDSNKGDYGTLVVIGGSVRYAGAVILAHAGAAALSVGCGITRIAAPLGIVSALHYRITECTLFPLSEAGGYINFSKDEVKAAVDGAAAVVCGVGLGVQPQLFPLVEWLIKNVKAPLLLDADALNILSHNTDLLYCRTGSTIITPHIKEMSRLSKAEVSTIKMDKESAAKDFAKKYNITVLLKDYESVITDGEIIIINKTGTPAMAKGGSGDVLSGIIGGLLARKIAPLSAAAAGAYITGKAAENALDQCNEYSLMPSDTAKSAAAWLTKLIKDGTISK